MIKVLIVSDSHGDIDVLEEAIDREKNIDYIFHLGDHYFDMEMVDRDLSRIPVACVKGNCDYGREKTERCFELGGIKIFMTHGQYYGVKMSFTKIYYKGREEKADLVLFGHTHYPTYKEYGDVVLFNPGTIGMRRPGDRSYGILEINEENGEYDLYHKNI